MSSPKTETTKVQADRREADGGEALVPLVDIYERPDGEMVLLAELPGADAESLDIRVDKGVLTIHADGELEELGEQYARTYVGFVGGRYFRAFALSDEIDRDRIEAALEDGLLTIRLPKAAAARTRKIEIK
ncbi:MAG: Hsp20/alpha crystallin family protein [Planctomycetes bacterium]|nr:Hsp20/alpha crystallin family protein [Planctomycetota bacterium]